MMGGYFTLALLVLIFDGVFGEEVSVKEGKSVTLNTGVPKKQDDKMRWYFNNTLIAHVNGEASTSCLYDGEGGIFRDRLEVDYETGSLTITNTRSEHTGYYEAEFIQFKSSGNRESLNRNSKCDGTKIVPKTSKIGDIVKSFRLIVTAADPDKTAEKYQKILGDKEPGKNSGQSPVAKAGIFVFAVSVAVALLV